MYQTIKLIRKLEFFAVALGVKVNDVASVHYIWETADPDVADCDVTVSAS